MQTEPPKAEQPKRKRRWFKFSLRSLMIVVTLLAVPCGWFGWHVALAKERKVTFMRLLSDGRDGKRLGMICDEFSDRNNGDVVIHRVS